MNTLRNHPNLVRGLEAVGLVLIVGLGDMACAAASGTTPTPDNPSTTAPYSPPPRTQHPSCKISSQNDAMTSFEEKFTITISEGGDPSSVRYTFGDGNSDNSGRPEGESHTYAHAGPFNVVATAVDVPYDSGFKGKGFATITCTPNPLEVKPVQ